MKRCANPFADEYTHQEIAWLAQPLELQVGRARVEGVQPPLVREDYFNKMIAIRHVELPMLTIDDRLWMSLSYREVQSHYLAIQRARGQTATLGLGLGYFALRAANKRKVEKVTVFEQNPDVIALFEAAHGRRRQRKKIEIVEGDARELCQGWEFDFLFADIYPTMLEDEALEDLLRITATNDIGQYQWWGEERVLLDAVMEGDDVRLLPDEQDLFDRWRRTRTPHAIPGMINRLPQWYDLRADKQYRQRAIRLMGRDSSLAA